MLLTILGRACAQLFIKSYLGFDFNAMFNLACTFMGAGAIAASLVAAAPSREEAMTAAATHREKNNISAMALAHSEQDARSANYSSPPPVV